MSEEAREGIEILQHHFGGVDERKEGDKQTNGPLTRSLFREGGGSISRMSNRLPTAKDGENGKKKVSRIEGSNGAAAGP